MTDSRSSDHAEPLTLRTALSIARGRVDAGLAGRGGPVVWQRLAEDLDLALATLAAVDRDGLREAVPCPRCETVFHPDDLHLLHQQVTWDSESERYIALSAPEPKGSTPACVACGPMDYSPAAARAILRSLRGESDG